RARDIPGSSGHGPGRSKPCWRNKPAAPLPHERAKRTRRRLSASRRTRTPMTTAARLATTLPNEPKPYALRPHLGATEFRLFGPSKVVVVGWVELFARPNAYTRCKQLSCKQLK